MEWKPPDHKPLKGVKSAEEGPTCSTCGERVIIVNIAGSMTMLDPQHVRRYVRYGRSGESAHIKDTYTIHECKRD